MIWYLIGAVTFTLFTTVYDTIMSEKGIKAGVAVEANLTWLYGTNKPTTLDYYLVNIPIVFVVAVPSIVGYLTGNSALYYAGLAAPLMLSIKHIQGGLEWRALGVKLL